MNGEDLFALALLFAWSSGALHLLWSDRPVYAASAGVLAQPVRVGRAAALLLATVGFVTLVWAWTANAAPRASAALVILALFALRQFEIRRWEGDAVVRLGKYAPAAACLLGWLCAALVLPAFGFGERESVRLAWEAAAGVMASLYVLAGLSKLKKTGLNWMKYQHQALLIAERAFTGPAWVRRVRRDVSRRPRVCALIGVVGLWAELLFGLYVIPDLRLPLTVLVLGLHASIFLLLGYLEPEWLLAMVGITAVTLSPLP